MDNPDLPRQRSYLLYNPERIDYSVTGEELERLRGGQSLWKDFCLVFASLGVPCLINAIADTQKMPSFTLSLSLFLNYLFGVLGILLAVVFGIAWHRSHQSFSSLIEAIKSKPKLELTPSTENVGALQVAATNQTQASAQSNLS